MGLVCSLISIFIFCLLSPEEYIRFTTVYFESERTRYFVNALGLLKYKQELRANVH